MTPLKVFLADDHGMIRAGLKALIELDPTLTVVGEARDGEEVIARVPVLAPDILVLDITMPKLSGTQAARHLRSACPRVKIIALSMHDDPGHFRELMEAGVAGYALKLAAADELLRAIHVVAEGKFYLDPSLTGELLKLCVGSTGHTKADLSDREDRVLRMVAEGYSTKEISAALSLSVKTVDTYKLRSMEKLGLKSRVDIIRHARQAGWFNA